mmetsp:Transcript_39073/g.47303  ORF Transcript_39073/g.47303 Transcript_39073/m.47303 type:complete len:90 (+) Transcript_39073:22-291(+)
MIFQNSLHLPTTIRGEQYQGKSRTPDSPPQIAIGSIRILSVTTTVLLLSGIEAADHHMQVPYIINYLSWTSFHIYIQSAAPHSPSPCPT